ncbi:U3 small nucleolar RNA-interacting protein 2 [Armadillidium vulgare]|nr:U3 small nucleolar RNA-interacting protein 2 [Armadillidium vulgare]
MSFFIRGRGNAQKLNKKVKRKAAPPQNAFPSKKKKSFIQDEEITSDEDEVTFKKQEVEFVEESAQEKKIRLAQQFLDELKKERSIEGQKLSVISRNKESNNNIDKGHRTHILSLAVSTDGKFLASGDCDGIINIWEAESLKHLRTFTKHRGAVSGLCFRKGSHTLYSCSHDRMVMIWNLDVMAFADNLGGHQDAITGIDSLYRESCITCGGRDEMVIVYVIIEEKQLRFSAFQSSIDGVKLINERNFCYIWSKWPNQKKKRCSLALWTTLKKKPHSVIQAAHGKNPENNEPFWLTSVASLVNTDVIASGSLDGFVRLWKVDHSRRKLEEMFSIPVKGVVNGLEFTPSGTHLIAAVGQEHKLGRWFTEKSAKNSLVIIPLRKKS